MKSLSNGVMAAHAVQRYLQGDKSGFTHVAQSMKADYQYYQQMRQYYYQLEQRWPDAEFWRLFHISSQVAA